MNESDYIGGRPKYETAADETQVINPAIAKAAAGRRVTQIELADGNRYAFAELPASTAMATRFAGALEGRELDGRDLDALHSAMRQSLVLGGLSREDAEDALWLVDLNAKEVVAAVTAAVFPGGNRSRGAAVGATDGVVRPGVGNAPA